MPIAIYEESHKTLASEISAWHGWIQYVMGNCRLCSLLCGFHGTWQGLYICFLKSYVMHEADM